MVDLPDIVAEVQSMKSVGSGDGVDVRVEVNGPKGTPDFTRHLRARAQAIKAAGVMPMTAGAIEDLTMGEIRRLTRNHMKNPERRKSGPGMEATMHVIHVER